MVPTPQEVLESCGAWISRSAQRIKSRMPWADLDDLIQHGVMIALEQRDHFEPQRDVEFPYFVRQKVFGGMIDMLRHEGVRQRGRAEMPEEDLEEITASAIEIIIDAENRVSLTASIASLPEQERIAVSLFYLEEMTNKEIAKILGVSESYANKLRNQALKRIFVMMTDPLPRDASQSRDL